MPKDPVMVTTKKYGKLKQSDVYRMVEQRRRVADILKEARRTALLPEAAKQLQAMYGKFMDADMIQAAGHVRGRAGGQRLGLRGTWASPARNRSSTVGSWPAVPRTSA